MEVCYMGRVIYTSSYGDNCSTKHAMLTTQVNEEHFSGFFPLLESFAVLLRIPLHTLLTIWPLIRIHIVSSSPNS